MYGSTETVTSLIVPIVTILTVLFLIRYIWSFFKDIGKTPQQPPQPEAPEESEKLRQMSLMLEQANARKNAAEMQFEDLNNRIIAYNQERKATARRRYITKRMREYVLQRDDYTCQICGVSRKMFEDVMPGLGDFLLLEIDHVVAVANGGTGGDENNLQTLCWRCNRKKGKTRTNEDVMGMIDYKIPKQQ